MTIALLDSFGTDDNIAAEERIDSGSWPGGTPSVGDLITKAERGGHTFSGLKLLKRVKRRGGRCG